MSLHVVRLLQAWASSPLPPTPTSAAGRRPKTPKGVPGPDLDPSDMPAVRDFKDMVFTLNNFLF